MSSSTGSLGASGSTTSTGESFTLVLGLESFIILVTVAKFLRLSYRYSLSSDVKSNMVKASSSSALSLASISGISSNCPFI